MCVSESPTAADKSKEKAKLRRQQVRKAQIQHRTRKTNYTKQLELDISRLRDMIAAAEKEVQVFRHQNEGMKGALRARGMWVPGEEAGNEAAVLQQQVVVQSVPSQLSPQPPSTHEPQVVDYNDYDYDYDPYPPAELFADINMGEVTVTMRKDDALGTPCFQITPTSPAVVYSRNPFSPDQLSPEQEVIAINLILAMEHICWNHFHPRQFPAHGDVCKAASGHALMASTMCMSSAPQRVYRTIRRGEADRTTHMWQASSSASPGAGPGSSLSLRSLLALAKALNPGDIELTPVQAWFELAARYGPAALMEERVVEALKRGFCGVVDCIHFGAIIERDAFESVVARVMEEVGVQELGEMEVDEGERWVGQAVAV
ncbi:hypothetical protein CCHL11_01678 [Colletotrichum chlorophyti]|uniref:BZIP domain-containing protein n=1 Tax=Colletotrichum chlorophyti TaxID=708187 RepID=A0A1Q8RVP0_9PEZI|nr:hypothetical protein CCHL11_01678 [Colletotrichum chlorophyti]